MSALSKRERVEAALQGAAVDRVPVSAWRHFLAEENDLNALAQVSLQHFRDFDWDWLKVNPRATYYAEAWGNRYDFSDYDSVLPRLLEGPLNSADDLGKIQPLNPTAGVFAEHLELVKLIKAGIGDAHFQQTVFSPLSVLAFLLARTEQHDIGKILDAQYDGLRRFIREKPQETHQALQNIATTLAGYASASVDAGASGIFFAIVKLARQGVISEAEFNEFGRPYDLQVLQAVQGAPFNMLHICGPYTYFEAVTEYPVHAINWATLGQHNPTLAEAALVTPKAVVGGVDEIGTLQTGTADEVTTEALAAIQATNGRHFLLSPGCGTSTDVPDANLHALRQAASLAATVA